MPKATTPPEVRFFRFVVESGDCWIWTAARDKNGYGLFKGSDNRMRRAHRWCYEYLRDEIPTGLMLDHLCRNHSCVNPWHLEPVTNAENVRRGARGELHPGKCKWGHDFEPFVPGTRRQRYCKTCQAIRWAKSDARRRRMERAAS